MGKSCARTVTWTFSLLRRPATHRPFTVVLEALARRNVELFDEMGVNRIISLSPHAYNAMKNEYPRFGGDYHVLHYSQVLAGAHGQGGPG